MNTGRIEVICGSDGSGKTAMAFGKALYALSQQKQVIVIQFLKGCGKRQDSLDIFKRLEPELKVFRFEKSDHYYESLTPDEKEEECCNIKNGLNYARKVLTTGECDLLILDEALGLVDQGIVTAEELLSMTDCRDEADVILERCFPRRFRKRQTRLSRLSFCEPLKDFSAALLQNQI